MDPDKHPVYRGIDGTTHLLLLLRVVLTCIPQFGYIHPDEFFQSTEITAGDILHTDSYRPWEFTTENPVRCAVFVHLFAYLPYKVLSYVGHSAYLRLIMPRLVACFLSFIVDYVAYKIRGPSAVKIVASSYLAMTYFTRTFSNLTESVLLALLLLMSFYLPVGRIAGNTASPNSAETKAEPVPPASPGRKKPSAAASTGKKAVSAAPSEKNEEAKVEAKSKSEEETHEAAPPQEKTPPKPKYLQRYSEFSYATVIVCGVFNRPTFLCFALTPFLHRFYMNSSPTQFLAACIRLSIYAIPSFCLLIAIDSIYYRGFEEVLADPAGNLVITPLNFLSYNSNSKNLANHGLHQRWLHIGINIPLLFGLHSIFFYSDLYRLILRGERFSSELCTLLGTTIVPLLVLSAFPHQEPRFLLPLLLPFALRNATKLLRSDRSCLMWYAFNLYMFFFFGLVHQGGVLPMQINSFENGTVIYFHTYMPPRHLTPNGVNRKIVDLKEANLAALESALQENHEGYLVYPAGVRSLVNGALHNVVCTVTEGISRHPHVATEYLPAVLRTCGFDLRCLLFDSLNLIRVKFRCESIL